MNVANDLFEEDGLPNESIFILILIYGITNLFKNQKKKLNNELNLQVS